MGLPNKHIEEVALDTNLGDDPTPMDIELKLSLISDAGGKALDATTMLDEFDQLAMLVQLTTLTRMNDIQRLPARLNSRLPSEAL